MVRAINLTGGGGGGGEEDNISLDHSDVTYYILSYVTISITV